MQGQAHISQTSFCTQQVSMQKMQVPVLKHYLNIQNTVKIILPLYDTQVLKISPKLLRDS